MIVLDAIAKLRLMLKYIVAKHTAIDRLVFVWKSNQLRTYISIKYISDSWYNGTILNSETVIFE